ncbi:MAG: DUF1559 domain-containing protein [Planctomycetota bacterium]
MLYRPFAVKSRTHPESAMPFQRAFTLIELLVVISIIALLIAILLPALSKARESADIMVCTNNVRSFSQAMFTYQADWGTLPKGAEAWEGSQNRYGGHNWYQTLMGTGEQGAIGTGYMGDNVKLETRIPPSINMQKRLKDLFGKDHGLDEKSIQFLTTRPSKE